MKTKIFGMGIVLGLFLFSSIAFAQTITSFQDLINAGRNIGVFEFFLPFILTFAVFYGLLLKSGIFGKSADGKPDSTSRTISVIIALAAAGFVMVYSPVGFSLAQFLTQFFANSLVAILGTIVALLFLTMIINALGGFPQDKNPLTENAGLIVLISIVIAVGIYLSAGGSIIFPGISAFGISQDTLIILIAVVLVGLLAWMLAR